MTVKEQSQPPDKAASYRRPADAALGLFNQAASRRTAIIVGALFLIVNVAFLSGALSIGSVLDSPDYLALVSAKRGLIGLGVLLELINGVAYLGIALLMYPFLRRHNASLAIGYVGIRLVEFTMQILGDLSPLALLTVSERFVSAGAPPASYFQEVGAVLLDGRHWSLELLTIPFGLAALLFYYSLYHTRLLPRFISIWGLVGSAAVMAGTVAALFGLNLQSLGILMLTNELFLGIWLIVRGFNSPEQAAPTVLDTGQP